MRYYPALFRAPIITVGFAQICNFQFPISNLQSPICPPADVHSAPDQTPPPRPAVAVSPPIMAWWKRRFSCPSARRAPSSPSHPVNSAKSAPRSSSAIPTIIFVRAVGMDVMQTFRRGCTACPGWGWASILCRLRRLPGLLAGQAAQDYRGRRPLPKPPRWRPVLPRPARGHGDPGHPRLRHRHALRRMPAIPL